MKTKWPFLLRLALLLAALFSLRLEMGLQLPPLTPVVDEVQTYLIGLKYYATGDWPYYGPDIVKPPENQVALTQDPGALEGLLIGLPLKVWPSVFSPFVLLNLLSLSCFSFLAWYASKCLPKLSPWFIFPWVLIAPWSVHYSTGMINTSYSMAIACVFFPALLECLPSLRQGILPLPLANALMGFSLAFWMQFHRTWVLVVPFLLASFWLQRKFHPKMAHLFYFALGALPSAAFIFPTLLRPDYHFFRDAAGLSFGFNFRHFREFHEILAKFLILAGFEMPRFIGAHTADRAQYLAQHWYLYPGFFLWGFGFLQVLVFIIHLFDNHSPHPRWKPLKLLLVLAFLVVYVSLLFTQRDSEPHSFSEMLPVVMIYSLYVWERWWVHRWARSLLWFSLACALVFQTGYALTPIPGWNSLYTGYGDVIRRAIQERNYHLLGERREGSRY